MMRVPYLWLFVTALCNARVSVDVSYIVSYLPIVPRGFFSAVVAALSYCIVAVHVVVHANSNLRSVSP